MQFLILSLIKLYKKTISRAWGAIRPYHGCRFYPSCADYCSQAIRKYGARKGPLMGFKRILKCNPFNEGGIDIC